MKLEHANLVVTAIEPTVAFLTAAFPGWRVRGRGDQPFAGMARQWVHVGDDEFYLALTAYDISAEEKGRPRDLAGAAPGLAHIGFEVSSLDDVVARLKASAPITRTAAIFITSTARALNLNLPNISATKQQRETAMFNIIMHDGGELVEFLRRVFERR